MARGKNKGGMLGKLHRILAGLRADGRRRDQILARMDRRLESLESRRRARCASPRGVDGGRRSTSRMLDDAAQALSDVARRARRREKLRP